MRRTFFVALISLMPLSAQPDLQGMYTRNGVVGLEAMPPENPIDPSGKNSSVRFRIAPTAWGLIRKYLAREARFSARARQDSSAALVSWTLPIRTFPGVPRRTRSAAISFCT